MLTTTLERLRCPARPKKGRGSCDSSLSLKADRTQGSGPEADVLSGELECTKCRARFPILGGVAVLVRDVRGFLLEHVKGVTRVVPDAELPREFARELKAAKAELQAGHIEDDLEAERVISLYLMNHYLHVEQGEWWRPQTGGGSPLIDSLVKEYWEQGPLARIAGLLAKLPPQSSVVELGCGVGGLAPRLGKRPGAYLGVDSSFSSIALARHLVLGAPSPGKIKIPEDLLAGPVSRQVLDKGLGALTSKNGAVDFVVGELEYAPIARGQWDVSVALNTIDMLEEPAALPELQKSLLKPGGRAVQSCPYIWHETVARKLRARLPKSVSDSAGAVEWLYSHAGFKIESREDHVPWLFFKHVRQLEIYSVHLFVGKLP